jgi:hypothetical protein
VDYSSLSIYLVAIAFSIESIMIYVVLKYVDSICVFDISKKKDNTLKGVSKYLLAPFVVHAIAPNLVLYYALALVSLNSIDCIYRLFSIRGWIKSKLSSLICRRHSTKKQ